MGGENWSYLCGVTQDFEADIIIGLLNEECIPAIKKYPGAGSFLKIAYGLTTGVDLYVPNCSREVALQLIQESISVPLDKGDDITEGNFIEAKTVHDASASTLFQTSLIKLVFFLAVLILVCVFAYNSNILW